MDANCREMVGLVMYITGMNWTRLLIANAAPVVVPAFARFHTTRRKYIFKATRMFCEHLSATAHLGLPFRQDSIPLLVGLHKEMRLKVTRNTIMCLDAPAAYMGLISSKGCKLGVVGWNITRRCTWMRTADNRRSAYDVLVAIYCGSTLVSWCTGTRALPSPPPRRIT